MADGVKEFRTRIGRVIRKGGADLKVIDGKFVWHGQAAATVEALGAAAQTVAEHFPDMAGYVVMGWDAAGRYSLGYRSTPASSIPLVFLPAFVGEALRENITTNAAVDWMNSQR